MITRSLLAGGPAYANYNSLNFHFLGDTAVELAMVQDVIEAGLYGPIDEIQKDLIIKASGTLLYYDTAQLTTLFPYIAGVIGTTYPGNADKPCAWNSNNGDILTLTSAMIGKMPDFELGVDGAVLGSMELWGVIGNGLDASNAAAYFTNAVAQSYSNPAVPGTAVLGRQLFTAVWGSVSGFTSFQAEDKWTVSHELKLEPVTVQGRTIAFKLTGYRVMAKCIPLGPTAAQIQAALYAQGTGAASGYRLSTNAANLVISGSNSITVTLGNAGLHGAGFRFGGKPLRSGELGWVSTLNTASGGAPSQAALTLA